MQVFDEDAKGNELIGSYDCELNKLLVAPNQCIKSNLMNGDMEQGTIILTGDAVKDSNAMARMEIICRIIDKKKKDKKGFLCFCKPPEDNPYLVIEKWVENDSGEAGEEVKKESDWIQVLTTEPVMDELEPEFSKIEVNMFLLCNNH